MPINVAAYLQPNSGATGRADADTPARPGQIGNIDCPIEKVVPKRLHGLEPGIVLESPNRRAAVIE